MNSHKSCLTPCVKAGKEGVEVSIQDHGRGIPKAEQERVFEPFYRVDPSRNKDTGGYGLGLSLCREIMRAHGGKIELESGAGRGTTVRILWPTHPTQTAKERQK